MVPAAADGVKACNSLIENIYFGGIEGTLIGFDLYNALCQGDCVYTKCCTLIY